MEEEEYTSGVETLSRLCDEQGLEHFDRESPACETHVFIDKAGNPHECWDSPHGMVNVVISMTPEQAVQLGETCHNVDIGTEGYFKCSECGASCSVDWEQSGWGVPCHCPNCGRKVTS